MTQSLPSSSQLQIGICQEHLPETEQQQGHFPSASAETEPCEAAAVDFQYTLREFSVERGTLCTRDSCGTSL